ncbi:MAG TPA: YihY/virulence factor BrkB family protein [Bacillales bacterium]|nr:YihY/virulence factor BrkB family protein [Bacillales bacterium]
MGIHPIPIVRRYSKVLFRRLMEDGIFDLSAQLAYYFLLSLFPFLIFSLALLGYLGIGSEAVLNLVQQYAPEHAFDIKGTIKAILDEQRSGLLSFGLLFTIWTASNAINALIRVLNKAYNVEESRHFVVARGLAVLLTLAIVGLIMVALALPVFGKVLGDFIFNHLGLGYEWTAVWDVLRWLVSFFLSVIVLSCLYFFAPNKRIRFEDVIVGAVIAAAGWQAASLGFSYYVGNFGHYEATYGSLGGFIVLMIWFYLTGFIIILGGEINAVNWYFENRRRR